MKGILKLPMPLMSFANRGQILLGDTNGCLASGAFIWWKNDEFWRKFNLSDAFFVVNSQKPQLKLNIEGRF